MQYQYIPEIDKGIFSLFPHRWDFIYSEHPKPFTPPKWQTESRYPLSDRAIRDGEKLYGVRFGATTSYLMIDIDLSSPYNPKQDRFAYKRILASLETLGLVRALILMSSYSKGIHIYLPFSTPLPTWKVATATKFVLESAGFTVEDGILEIFPNVRAIEDDQLSLYKAHRLPLQQGSYLLDESLQPTYHNVERFIMRWDIVSQVNEIDELLLEKTVHKATHIKRKLSYKASKFLSDLDAEIHTGWTSHGQTNHILGRITLRSYVFGHIIEGEQHPLTGDRLVAHIVATAQNLPGYQEFCRHSHEIWEKAEFWARSVSSCPRYYPYGGERVEPSAKPIGGISWNQWQMERARERICFALSDLIWQERLPAGTTDRFNLLIENYGFSGETLYRHRDLWHPSHLGDPPPDPPNISENDCSVCSEGATEQIKPQSLLKETDRNQPSTNGLNWFEGWNEYEIGGNTFPRNDQSYFNPDYGGIDGG